MRLAEHHEVGQTGEWLKADVALTNKNNERPFCEVPRNQRRSFHSYRKQALINIALCAICFFSRSREIRGYLWKEAAKGYNFSFLRYLFHQWCLLSFNRPSIAIIVCGKQQRSKWESRPQVVVVKSKISFWSRGFQNPRTRRTSQSASRNIRGGQQWRPIAYIPGEPVFTPANHPRVQTSYEGD